jgi:NTE family protein
MLFHLGALWRCNDAGLLPGLKRISSVSGGSITAGVLGLKWDNLAFDPQTGVGAQFVQEVVAPVRDLAGRTVDEFSIVEGVLTPWSTVADKVAEAYRKYLFGDATLQDLPGQAPNYEPRFVINATNVQSGALWRFMKPYMRDWRVGEVAKPKVSLAVAVAASSAFPPVLSPMHLELDSSAYTPDTGADLQREPFTTDVYLTDGGVYDNLGLETAWKRFRTILVSDGGAKMAPEDEPKRDWARHSLRILDLIDNQVRSLRKRQLIGSLVDGTRLGAYWGIVTDIANYQLADPLPCPVQRTTQLAQLPTRLKRLDAAMQERLINWGYAGCDAALRKHVNDQLARPLGFPYSERGV